MSESSLPSDIDPSSSSSSPPNDEILSKYRSIVQNQEEDEEDEENENENENNEEENDNENGNEEEENNENENDDDGGENGEEEAETADGEEEEEGVEEGEAEEDDQENQQEEENGEQEEDGDQPEETQEEEGEEDENDNDEREDEEEEEEETQQENEEEGEEEQEETEDVNAVQEDANEDEGEDETANDGENHPINLLTEDTQAPSSPPPSLPVPSPPPTIESLTLQLSTLETRNKSLQSRVARILHEEKMGKIRGIQGKIKENSANHHGNSDGEDNNTNDISLSLSSSSPFSLTTPSFLTTSTSYSTTLHDLHALYQSLSTQKKEISAKISHLTGVLEEKDGECSKLSRVFKNFKKEIIKGSVNNIVMNHSKNSEINEKIEKNIHSLLHRLDQYAQQEERLDLLITDRRLKQLTLYHDIADGQSRHTQMERMSNGLHLIDFEQLKIENVTLGEKIEERNDEIFKLRKKIQQTVQVMSHCKLKSWEMKSDVKEQEEAVEEINAVVNTLRTALSDVKKVRDALRRENAEKKVRNGFIGSGTLVLDYERRREEGRVRRERVEILRREWERRMGEKNGKGKGESERQMIESGEGDDGGMEMKYNHQNHSLSNNNNNHLGDTLPFLSSKSLSLSPPSKLSSSVTLSSSSSPLLPPRPSHLPTPSSSLTPSSSPSGIRGSGMSSPLRMAGRSVVSDRERVNQVNKIIGLGIGMNANGSGGKRK